METTTEREWAAVRREMIYARWPWPCAVCGREIAAGQQYLKISGKRRTGGPRGRRGARRDGVWICLRTCADCATSEESAA